MTNTPTEERQQWEYVIEYESPILPSNKKNHENRLNMFGERGCELASYHEDRSSLNAYYIFKRPKSPNPINTTP